MRYGDFFWLRAYFIVFYLCYSKCFSGADGYLWFVVCLDNPYLFLSFGEYLSLAGFIVPFLDISLPLSIFVSFMALLIIIIAFNILRSSLGYSKFYRS